MYLQRIPEIRQQIRRVFDAHRHPDQRLGDAHTGAACAHRSRSVSRTGCLNTYSEIQLTIFTQNALFISLPGEAKKRTQSWDDL